MPKKICTKRIVQTDKRIDVSDDQRLAEESGKALINALVYEDSA